MRNQHVARPAGERPCSVRLENSAKVEVAAVARCSEAVLLSGAVILSSGGVASLVAMEIAALAWL